MKALSVLQPWASAIFLGKDIENRTWPTRGYSGPLLIHASKGYDRDGADEFIADRGVTLQADLPRGAILGIVTVKGGHGSHACVRTGWDAKLHKDDPYECSPWAVGGNGGMCHWELADPHPLDQPIPCKGALGLWTPPDDVLVTAVLGARAGVQ